MDIGNALRRTGRDDITTRSTIAKVVENTLNYDFEVLSVKFQGSTVSVRTNNPLINSELQIQETVIKKTSQAKLEKLGIKLTDNIRFRFI